MPLDNADLAWLDNDLSAFRGIGYSEFLVRAGYLTADQREAHVAEDAPIGATNAALDGLGLLSAAQAKKASRSFQGRRYLAPDFLASLFNDTIARFWDMRRPPNPGPGDPEIKEIKVAVAAYAFGPLNAGPPSQAKLVQLAGVADFGTGADQQAVERVVHYGASLPSGPADWAHRWPLAWEALYYLVQRLIMPAVRWIGYRGLKIPNDELTQWAFQESGACAVHIRTALLQGCDCWRRWEDFHIKNELSALARCNDEHDLRSWPGTRALADFLFRAAINGNLRLPKNERGEQALVNGFRKGMLAKCICDMLLVAGPAPKCDRKRCHGEVQLNDRCENCGTDKGFKDPTWWLWLRESRDMHTCRRCKSCNRLFFNFDGPCPGCGQTNWSRDLTWVWIPISDPLDSQTPLPPGGPAPFQRMLDEEWRKRLRNEIEQLPELEQTIAGQVLLDGWMLDDAARQQGMELTSREFKKLISSIVEKLRRFLHDTDDFS